MRLLFFTFLCIFLLPTLSIGGVPIRAEDLIFILLVIAYPHLLVSIFSHNDTRFFLKLLFFFFISSLISLSLSILGGYAPVLQDMNSLFSVFRNIVVLAAGMIIGARVNGAFSTILLMSLIGPFVSSLVSIMQYFDIGGLGERLFLLVSSEERMQYGIDRAVGLIGNPNYAGFVQLIGFIILLCIDPNIIKRFRILYVIILLIIILSVYVTFSRTALIAMILISLCYMILKRRFKLMIAIVAISLLAVPYILNNMMSETRYSRMADNDETIDVTMGGRSNLIWEKKMEQFAESPFFGIGSARDIQTTTEFESVTYDNSFILLLVTSGIIGTLIILIFFFQVQRYFWQYKNADNLNALFLFICLINISVFLFFITTDLVKITFFTSFYYFIVGLGVTYVIGLNQNVEINENSSDFNTDLELE